jgi:4-amino-4-deoxy-L-arabinose transferase-like glycosyltransferase
MRRKGSDRTTTTHVGLASRAGDSTRVHLLGAARGNGAWTRGVGGGLALVLLCLVVLVPGLFVLPPIDRDEARFAQASRQMWTTSDWVVPMVQDRPRLNKPPLTYWLQGLTAKALSSGDPARDAIWMYRLPGAFAMMLSVLCTWRLGLRLMDPRAAWLGAAMLACSPLIVIDAHQARSDQLLLCSVVLTQCCMWKSMHTRGGRSMWGWTIATGLACGLGILAKGPITPMIGLLTLVMFVIFRREPRPTWRGVMLVGVGLTIAMLCILPWALLVGQRVGWEKYLAILSDETLGRSVEPKEGHWGPPGYHLALLVGLFFPGSLLAGAAVIAAVREGFHRTARWMGRPAVLYLLAWLIPAWLLFELIGTKLPHYVMPMYPALALLTARATLRASRGVMESARGVLARVGFVIWGVVGVALFAGVPIGLLLWRATPDLGPGISALAWVGGIGAGVLVLCATVAAMLQRPIRALLLAGIGSLLSLAITLQVLVPAASQLWVASQMAREVQRVDPQHLRPLAAFEYHEDSLIFLTHGAVDRVATQDRHAWLEKHLHEQPLVILPEGSVSEFPYLRPLARLDGFNYSRGRGVRLVLAEVLATTSMPAP